MIKAALTPESQVIERHLEHFQDKKILFAGDIQDDLPVFFKTENINVHTTQFHHYLRLVGRLGEQAHFSLLPDERLFEQTDTLIYYWPKSKIEAQFQISYLLNHLPKGADVFIIGENRSGVRSAENLLADFGTIQKIDTARRCSLYHFEAESRLAFDLNEWWQSYTINTAINDDIVIKALPGIFSAQHLDMGSDLLLNALIERKNLIKGKVLDIGCGAGVLATVAGKLNTEVSLTLTDVNAAALVSSETTLVANGLKGDILASDVFSHITGQFDLIISNPPFHDGRETSYFAVESLIAQAKKHLTPQGKLCLVANAFLPYPDLLDKAFGKHQVILQSNKFKVYLA